jgi:hypothetical protein
MFYDAMVKAIDATYPRQREQFDQMSRDVWRAHGAGQLSDDQAQELAEQIQKRRPAVAGALKSIGGPPVAPKRYTIQRSPEQRSPDRQASIERRRKNASRDMFPPQLDALFTTSERSILIVVAAEWLAHGVCDLSRNEIASRAGVSHSMVKRTMQYAEVDLGLFSIERRPRSGRKHLTNITRIIRADWIDWLNKGNHRAYAIAVCRAAKPDFGHRARQWLSSTSPAVGQARGVQTPPPRKEVLRNGSSRAVANTVKKE